MPSVSIFAGWIVCHAELVEARVSMDNSKAKSSLDGCEAMKQVKALLLDLDDTLLDSSPVRQAILDTCNHLASVLPGLTSSQILDANSAAWSSYWPTVEERWALGTLNGEDVSLEGWRRTFLLLGLSNFATAELARDTHARFGRESHKLFEDVEPFLTALPAEVSLGVITNGGSELQRQKLRVLALADRFDAIVISAEIGIAKPDPAVFALALDKLGIPPESAWHVGDSLRADVGGARAAGLAAVWLNRTGRTRGEAAPHPDYEIQTLSELPALIASAT